MVFSHFKGNFTFPGDFIEGQTFFDPFDNGERSKTTPHEKRFEKNQKSQKLMKNEENES